MPIADLLSPRVVSVKPDETVRVAITRMLEENVGSVAGMVEQLWRRADPDVRETARELLIGRDSH